MTFDEIIQKVSEDTGLSKSLVEKTYRAYWKAVKEYIASLPLKEDLSDEEFLKLRPNVNIPSLGKLHVTLSRYQSLRRVGKKIKEIQNLKEKENVAHQED
jgi:hypothetical protein